jgi:tetratricopeptide (TPR) repeat protein
MLRPIDICISAALFWIICGPEAMSQVAKNGTGKVIEEMDYNNNGVLKLNAGDYRGAIADFNKALVLNQNYTLPRVNRGLAKAAQGDDKGAIEDFNQAIRTQRAAPKDDIYYDRGVSRRDLGDLQGAIDDFSEAIRINSAEPSYYHGRGIVREQTGDTKGAAKDFDQEEQLQRAQRLRSDP